MDKKLKYLLTGYLALAASFSALAVHQYKELPSPLGVGLTMKMDSSLYVCFLNADGSLRTNFDDFYKFGYFLSNDKGMQYKAFDLSTVKDGVLSLGEFGKSDTIAFWAKNSNTTYNSLNGLGEIGPYRDSAYLKPVGELDGTLATLGDITTHGYSSEWLSKTTSSNLNFQISSENPSPSGQPLPGVLTTLLIGGGLGLGKLAMRRRKEHQKE